MKSNLYVIFDKVAEEASPVFQAKNDSKAAQLFHKSIPKEDDPHDYSLLRIGSYDSSPVRLYAFDSSVTIDVSSGKLDGEGI